MIISKVKLVNLQNQDPGGADSNDLDILQSSVKC